MIKQPATQETITSKTKHIMDGIMAELGKDKKLDTTSLAAILKLLSIGLDMISLEIDNHILQAQGGAK